MRASTPYLISFAVPLVTLLHGAVGNGMVVPPPEETNVDPVCDCTPANDGALNVPQADVASRIAEVCDSIPDSTWNKNQLSVYYPSTNNQIVDFCITIPALTARWPDSATCKSRFSDIVGRCKNDQGGATVNYGGGVTDGGSILSKTLYNVTISSREVVTTGPSALRLPRIPIAQKKQIKPSKTLKEPEKFEKTNDNEGRDDEGRRGGS